MFSPNKSFAVYLKTTPPRSGFTWKPMGRIFTYVGLRCCVDCGKLVSQDTTFVKGADGSTHASGHLVQLARDCSASYFRTLDKGNVVIGEIIEKYGISSCEHAKHFYQIAVERGFTRGRRTAQVAAACLYVACRLVVSVITGTGDTVLSLIFSELGVSVDHSFIQKPVDPSLYMHRYTSALLGKKNNKNVLNTALRLAVSMKRDWMQTGRKPSGICAAAIYVSSLLHGYKFTKTDVIEEFNQNAMDYEKEMRSCKQPSTNVLKMPGETEVVCQHKSSAVQSGFGLCKNCYMEFCGGLQGLEPPAFQRAETQRLAKESAEEVQRASPVSGKLSDTPGAFESSKDVPDNDTVVDETTRTLLKL
ncbi:Brf1-like TBP-binding protein [Tanacetum coccineum]